MEKSILATLFFAGDCEFDTILPQAFEKIQSPFIIAHFQVPIEGVMRRETLVHDQAPLRTAALLLQRE